LHSTDIAHNAKQYIYGAKIEIQNDQYLIDRHIIEWHKKYTLSLACLILFFVGAPFGAIFKKGGLGMPVVISTVVFIVYHVLTISGEKLAKSDWEIVNGIWLATYVLAPIGLFLSYKAMTDSPIFDFKKFKKLFSKSTQK
jgi:lipopolysaccharide export system permease protein